MMNNWDLYIEQYPEAKDHPLFEMSRGLIFFRKVDDDSYQNFRMIMQYIDCAVLDIETVQYPPQLMVLAFMYLHIGKAFIIQLSNANSLLKNRSSKIFLMNLYIYSRKALSISFSTHLSLLHSS